MTSPNAWAVIAGGGTAGHVHPALAVAEEIVARGRARSDVHFIGSSRGLEATLVPQQGFELTALPGRGIVRKLNVENLRSALGLGRAVVQSVRVLNKLKPSVVVSVGGYASAPAVVAAALLRRPIVVLEQNTVPGAANRLASRWAKVCATSFADTDLPNAVLTGNPIHGATAAVDRSDAVAKSQARRRLGVCENQHFVVAFGGSLGALSINTALSGALGSLTDRSDLCIRHVVGSRDWSRFGSPPDTGTLSYTAVEYETNMADLYLAADLMVCRAGATTVAELALTGTPAVLVPLPNAPGDHQTRNARSLSDNGGAIHIADEDLDSTRLIELVDELVGDSARLDGIETRARAHGHPQAAEVIVDLIERHATELPSDE